VIGDLDAETANKNSCDDERADALGCEVTRAGEVQAMFTTAHENVGSLDVKLNNAGILGIPRCAK
jgi:NAD(P)-dependent dehydrogenase (short-subunit alcohol dehydrogenase family)